jgi:outer membrane protein assembly factor BamB
MLPLCWLCGSLQLFAAGWPAYRADVARSGTAAAALDLPLELLWVHHSPQPPRAAWPPPARRSYWQRLEGLLPRVPDDEIFQPVAGEGLVVFGSSADDQVHALDAASGEIRWRFFTDGPVRYAPQIAGGRVFFASDDGNVYCVSARDGELIWKHRVGPRDRRIPGNGRIISSWPVRTGVLVDAEALYCLAGLFPSQGVYACALRAADGSVLWKRQVDISPAGYLLASRTHLYVPTGRGNPVALDRHSGRQLQSFDGVGGTFALLTSETLVAGRGSSGTLAASDLDSKDRLVDFQGRDMVVTPRISYLLGDSQMSAFDRVRFIELTREIQHTERRRDELQAERRWLPAGDALSEDLRLQIAGVSSRLEELRAERLRCELWRREVPPHWSLVLAGDQLVASGDGEVRIYGAGDGELAWSAALPGKALGLAVAEGRLVVATDRGALHCFAPAPIDAAAGDSAAGAPAGTSFAGEPQRSELRLEAKVEKLLGRLRAPARGYCLVLGAGDGRLAEEIALRSELAVIAIDRSAAAVEAVRARLGGGGLYGSRLSVHHIPGDELPFTDGFADLIAAASLVDDRPGKDWPESEVRRVLRPFGGLAFLGGSEGPMQRGPLLGAGEWTHLYANPANTAASGDRLIHRRLELQWFGGPGPERMVDRHLRGPPPLVSGGTMFVPGENVLMAVDAWNGASLWEAALPGSQRYSMPYDAGYMAAGGGAVHVAVRSECWVIDAASGKRLRALPVPRREGRGERWWGYVALAEGRLYGSVQKPGASRTRASREQIDSDYRSRQPVATSEALFRAAPESGAVSWLRERGAVINPTITLSRGRLSFVESRNPEALGSESGRVGLDVLLSSGAYLVALDAASGEELWEKRVDFSASTNILYLLEAEGLLIAAGSADGQDLDAHYHLHAFDAATGRELWRAEHPNRKPGQLFHGEQVHHPVALEGVLVAEPNLYELSSGKPLHLDGGAEPWLIRRPGHSCGTLSGAGTCLFFRASHPTVLDIGPHLAAGERLAQLAPSRTGCWINIIPASGLVLIPEASSGCVCHYSLQTSMAFRPLPGRRTGL